MRVHHGSAVDNLLDVLLVSPWPTEPKRVLSIENRVFTGANRFINNLSTNVDTAELWQWRVCVSEKCAEGE